ncbi:MAG: DsbA family oxidoreductase [Bacillales bacterium]|nr:DsbA family oxidoreductase [Bacillales bacterium]
MKIEIWSDFVCPFCYIGKRNFERALEGFKHKELVEVVYKSFQLDPTLPNGTTVSTYEMLSKKYNLTHEKAVQMCERVASAANQVGLEFDFEHGVQTNTFDAHRLFQYAKQMGKLKEMNESLLKAHFVDCLNVGDKETLLQIAVEVGLENDSVAVVLSDSGQFAEDVLHDQKQAQQIGVTGVPFFLINGKYAITGAQTSEAILQVIKQVWTEDNQEPIRNLNSSEEQDGCTDGSCSI